MLKFIILLCLLFSVFSPRAFSAETESNDQLLQEENAQLKNDNAGLEENLYTINRERKEILGKLEIIMDENAKLKEQITTLRKGLINLEGVRKQKTKDDEMQDTKGINVLKKEVKPVILLVREQSDESTGKTRFEDKGYEKKVSQLEQELSAAQKEAQELQAIAGKLEEQNKRYKKEKLQEKEVVDMYYNLGVIFQGQSKYNDAIREYNMALKFNPEDADTHYNLGLIYDTAKKDREKALHHYNKYLYLNPEAIDASRVKERIVTLSLEQKIWSEPYAKSLGPKEALGRW